MLISLAYGWVKTAQSREGSITIRVELHEGSTVRGYQEITTAANFTTLAITVPVSTIVNLANLTAKVQVYGTTPSGGGGGIEPVSSPSFPEVSPTMQSSSGDVGLQDLATAGPGGGSTTYTASAYVSWVHSESPKRNYTTTLNRLNKVVDPVPSTAFPADIDNQAWDNYLYDGNGNCIKDVQGGFTEIKYDYRNLPHEVRKSNGTVYSYRYDANGNRIQKYGHNGVNTSYLYDIGGRQCIVLNGTGDVRMVNLFGLDHVGYDMVTIQQVWIPPDPDCGGGGGGIESVSGGTEGLTGGVEGTTEATPMLEGGIDDGVGGATTNSPNPCEGYWQTQRTDSRYYYLKDHLGTVRMTVNSAGNVVSYDDYYPYGQVMEGRSMASSGDSRYKFLTKERDTESGLDWLGVRAYDARIGRFFTIDPLAGAGVLRSWSPYHYSFGNPIRYLDDQGKFALDVHRRVTNSALDGLPFNDRFTDATLSLIIYSNLWQDAVFHSTAYRHFDNEAITEGWDFVNRVARGSSLLDFGAALHAIQDFYSHTNYIQLAEGYFGEGAVPIFYEAAKDEEFARIWAEQGTSGYYPDGRTPPGKLSHGQLNRDGGLLPWDAKRNSKAHQMAVDLATSHSRRFAEDWLFSNGFLRLHSSDSAGWDAWHSRSPR